MSSAANYLQFTRDHPLRGGGSALQFTDTPTEVITEVITEALTGSETSTSTANVNQLLGAK
jgi:hypothetical protein